MQQSMLVGVLLKVGTWALGGFMGVELLPLRGKVHWPAWIENTSRPSGSDSIGRRESG